MKVSTAALITIKSKSWGYYEEKMEDHANPSSEQKCNHLHGNISVETFPSTDRLQYCVFKSEFRISLNKHLQETKLPQEDVILVQWGFVSGNLGENPLTIHITFVCSQFPDQSSQKYFIWWPDTQGNIVCNARSQKKPVKTSRAKKPSLSPQQINWLTVPFTFGH